MLAPSGPKTRNAVDLRGTVPSGVTVRVWAATAFEKVADPACGSGGFLIYAMDKVYKDIEKNWDKIDEIADHKKDYAQEMIYGLDYDDRLVKVCKAYMLIWGDGRSNIKCQDA